MTDTKSTYFPTSTHWGPFTAEVKQGRLTKLHPSPKDPRPSRMGESLADAVHAKSRVTTPAIRKSYLEHGPSSKAKRGHDSFVSVSWDTALDCIAKELERVKNEHGNEAIFAGSYGWASAGRFHHAPYQLWRFMNLYGGFTTSVNAYSYAAAEVIMPRVVGKFLDLQKLATSWPVLAEHTELHLMFGGMPSKNAQVGHGGPGRHMTHIWQKKCLENGAQFINISPLKEDAEEFLNADWIAIRPCSDVALMLGLAHTIYEYGKVDRDFLEKYCVGYNEFEAYLTGKKDGIAKTAKWAAAITDVDETVIKDIAKLMTEKRCMINVSWSLQRSRYGEQPYWMAVTLAAMLGQIGLPGGGFGVGYSAVNDIGNPLSTIRWNYLPVGDNPVSTFIPVARIADTLLQPGKVIDYDGQKITLPDLKIIYWAGGNPFHHHQDLNRLQEAWKQPDTVIVNETFWTSTARHADIVLPASTSLERNDIAFNPRDAFAVPMHKALDEIGESKSDFDIFSMLAGKLGFSELFTESRSEMQWLEHLYQTTRENAQRENVELPDFETFWNGGPYELPSIAERTLLGSFRESPEQNPLCTPSGKIEIHSAEIASFGYDDCPPHPTWMAPEEWLGSALQERFPLHLLSNQPRTRLHSQLDDGRYSQEDKINGKEPVRMHPIAAKRRGIKEGDIVRIFNDRGACLAGARLDEGIREDVVQLATGAWFDPATEKDNSTLCRHGNPNILTPDKPTSKLAQGPTSFNTLVQIERYDGELAASSIHEAPL